MRRVGILLSFSRAFPRTFRAGNVNLRVDPLSNADFPRSVHTHCWKCQELLPENRFSLLCPTCHSLQKVESVKDVNYYKIFGERETYRIDLSKLSVEMKILQKNLHPDLFSLKTKEEQKLSEELSSLVNKAYSTLQNPIERAQYLLQLRGIDPETMEKKMTSDVEFLTEVMELNERLEEVDNLQDWAQFREENDEKLHALLGDLNTEFEQNNIDAAVIILSKIKYYDNLQNKLKQIQTKLGVVD